MLPSLTPGIEDIPGAAIGRPNAERWINAGSATLAEARVRPVPRKWRRVNGLGWDMWRSSRSWRGGSNRT